MTDTSLRICIAGTDTDAGKTAATAALARVALAAGFRALVIKPVQTGSVPDAQGKLQPPDPAVYSEAAPGADTRCLAQFAAACSPHLASRIEASSKNSEVCGENAPLTARDLAEGVTRAVREWAAAGTSGANTSEHCRNLILLEGAGGLLTPISESETLADLFTLLGWPVLLVAANRLGTVNHALLSLEALRSRNLPCPGFIMVETEESRNGLDREIRRDNPRITASLGKKPCLAELPYAPGLTAPNLTDREAAWDKIARKAAPALDALCARQNFQRKDIVFTDDADLLRFDREHLWHPYTSATRPIRVWEAAGGSGSRIRLKDGRELIDGMASWWCAIHGYRHPALMRALQAQAETMPHVMFGGLTHAPAARLGKKLLDMAPSSLEYVFFADSGSVAVEAALKMALQYWQAAGEKQRARIMTVRGGYHGDTLGAMSVCDPENGMHSLFSGILPAQIFAPRPECRFDAPYDPASERAFADTLAARADSVAAVILEPIVQGAGGMWFYHPDFLRGVHALCKRYGCLLILDEIATGFGRAGKLFACEHAGVYPDILCLGKGLSGGVLTLAATLATREVADGISRNGGVFMHGPTFMANPLACSVAEASLELIASGDWRMDVARLETGLRDNLAGCANKPGVADVRVLGAIGVVEMEREVNSERLQAFFVDQGVWIRPFGRLVYVMPPYVATDDDIAALCAAIHRALDQEAWR